MGKNLIIAFLLGLLVSNLAFGLKVPNVILGKNIDPDLKEIIEDYVIKILNESRYQIGVSTVAVASTDQLDSGELVFDNSAVTKYLVVSDGETNYRVQVTAVP